MPREKKEREGKWQTIQCQHGGEIFAVGDSGRVSDAQLPQIGKVGRRGEDDGPSQRVHLPVFCRQGGCHQHPPRGGQDGGHDLQHHSAHPESGVEGL